MPAVKKINVASPPKLTDAVTAGADVTITHFRIRATANGTIKTPFKTLAAARTLSANGKLEVADENLQVTQSGFSDTLNASILDTNFVSTDVIEWSTDGSTVTSRLAATVVGAWDNAVTV